MRNHIHVKSDRDRPRQRLKASSMRRLLQKSREVMDRGLRGGGGCVGREYSTERHHEVSLRAVAEWLYNVYHMHMALLVRFIIHFYAPKTYIERRPVVTSPSIMPAYHPFADPLKPLSASVKADL